MAYGEDMHEGQRKRATAAFGPGYRLPEGGLGRLLALWGFTSVPFYRAFHEPSIVGPVALEPRDVDTSISAGEWNVR